MYRNLLLKRQHILHTLRKFLNCTSVDHQPRDIADKPSNNLIQANGQKQGLVTRQYYWKPEIAQ